MSTLIGILVLLIGVAFPMGTLVWLNGRMRRPPVLLPRQVGMLLALNGILPLVLILTGLWLLHPPFDASLAFKAVLIAGGIAVLGLLVGLWWVSRKVRRKGDPNGG